MQFLFILLIVVGCIVVVNTYQCYVCSSPLDDGCGDPFNSNMMTDDKKEDAGGQVCMKIKATTAVTTGILRILSSPEACIGIMNGCREQSSDLGKGTHKLILVLSETLAYDN
ncbi:hypothetical protein I4U23_004629 [Adineta vaga]|nr:hypothetical protein I4U23_004629 [Adineta vaga]